MKKIYDKMTVKIKKEDDQSDIHDFILQKIKYFQEIIRNTILSIQQYKSMELFSNSDANICMANLNEMYEKTCEIIETIDATETNIESTIESLQQIIDKLYVIIGKYGTKNFDDLLFICFGSQYIQQKYENPILQAKIELIRKFVHPINYKNVYWKPDFQVSSSQLCSNKLSSDILQIEKSDNYECHDNDNTVYKTFSNKIHGIRVIIQNVNTRRTLIINGIIDNIDLCYITNPYIDMRKKMIFENNSNIDNELLKKYINTLSIKDMLIFGDTDIVKKYMNIFKDVSFIKTNSLENILKKFTELDVHTQRNMLINLLCYNDDSVKYTTYLLYDLITANHSDNLTNTGSSVDSKDQTLIYDSFPWSVKQFFKDAMKFTIKYTQDMIQKYDINRVSLEQQIYVLNIPEYIKEKAMIKLKEIKGRTDESSSKAKQYLEGLLKIPFGLYKKEPILNSIHEINADFIHIVKKMDHTSTEYMNLENCIVSNVENYKKDKYTNNEIMQHVNKNIDTITSKIKKNIISVINDKKNKELIKIIETIQCKNCQIVKHTKKKENMQEIIKCINNQNNIEYVYDIHKIVFNNSAIDAFRNQLVSIKTKIQNVRSEIASVKNILDKSIHGHSYAKNQILKIVGQWMNGTQAGYCFGFEGSPGIGKTSLAKKGLANCLIDADGKSRPFAFIALGGSSNGSTLEGHSYTYVNSMWGRIVDILMETKCMNPIIYIDELDKVSKTEHGKEIIGILTHLIDATQNDCFQDKYYSGINIDLSKALFIFSYNDPDNIDRILLDRIHRIHFDNLSMDEKKVIVKEYLLPEVNEKMGFQDTVVLDESVIEHIIENYTIEPGIRKLKEIIFDLYGEINLELLDDNTSEIPIIIKIDELESKYLKKYNKIQDVKINTNSAIGIINGLWANSLGKGGIIPIETMLYPCSSFLELRLTGLQGDVMKESMNVAKSLAWSLTTDVRKRVLLKEFEETKCQGLHIHCPQGAVSKDGPSAGAAITSAIYSLFNEKKIKNNIAITGEINLQGQITAIGGLDVKILGGIRAGITTFLYPTANAGDYEKFIEKYGDKSILDNIVFVEIQHITEVFENIFE
jgi:hypothetical protein